MIGNIGNIPNVAGNIGILPAAGILEIFPVVGIFPSGTSLVGRKPL